MTMTDKIQVFYSDHMIAHSDVSPSAAKPALVAQALREHPWLSPLIEFVEPEPVTVQDFCLAHDRTFVENVFTFRARNGFGTRSRLVAHSLPYTTGAMLGAARAALKTGRNCAALCSGFHHAGYAHSAGFCTFNGLMVTALKLFTESGPRRHIAIIDADQHYGDGTQDIIDQLVLLPRDRQGLGPPPHLFHYSFGQDFSRPNHARAYLEKMRSLAGALGDFGPDLIIYQAGADAHRDDPLGGVLTTEELLTRDEILFGIARSLGAPVAWNLAGGYQREADGSIPKVIKIHLNTFRASMCASVPPEVPGG